MGKIYVLLFIVFCSLTNNLLAQTLTETQKLQSLCKVWGFLKYYHPQVSKGKFHWDEQLIDKIPMSRQAQTKEELSRLYLEWIDNLGKVPLCRSCSKPSNKKYFDRNFDLSWIDDELFTNELSSKLRFIEANRFQGKHHYVEARNKKVGNVSLKNEPSYPDFDWSNREMRLLIVFKYWNIVEYFFPYKYQMDTPWDIILAKTIKEMEKVESQTDFYNAFSKMVVSINDAHAGFYPPGDTYRWSPHVVKYIEGKMVVTGNRSDSLAKFSPLEKGDVIKNVDGRSIEKIIKAKEPYVNGSNPASKYRNLSYYILSSINTDEKAKVLFDRKGKEQEVLVPRYERKYFKRKKDEKAFKVLNSNIGYLNLASLTIKQVPEAMEAMAGTKGLIVDVRNYPKGTLHALANHLSSTRKTFFKVTRPDYDYPGRFYMEEGFQCGGLKRKWFYSNEVALLVNEMTQSHAEFTVMALQTGDNVTTIGSQTAGADGNISRLQLANGIKTQISGIGIFYPDGNETQRKGIKIDIEVKPSIQGVIEKRDEILERAIEFLNKIPLPSRL